MPAASEDGEGLQVLPFFAVALICTAGQLCGCILLLRSFCATSCCARKFVGRVLPGKSTLQWSSRCWKEVGGGWQPHSKNDTELLLGSHPRFLCQNLGLTTFCLECGPSPGDCLIREIQRCMEAPCESGQGATFDARFWVLECPPKAVNLVADYHLLII